MKWIKASERLPERTQGNGEYVCRSIVTGDKAILKRYEIMSQYEVIEWLDESEPSPSEDVQSNDMTAKEFFDSPESPVTLDKICSPVEKEFLLDTIELYAKGKVHQALKATSTPPAKDNWVKIEEGLPEEEEWVLVHNQEVDDCPVTIGVYVNGRWRILELGVDVEQIVTHWQPLPTPPTT